MKSPVAGESTDSRKSGTTYQIGTLARLTGVPIKTIRYYSDAGLLAPAGRTASKYRLYGPADRVRLEQIRVLRELGFGLDAIAQLLRDGAAPHAVIEAQLAAIERERASLARASAVLRAALAGAGRSQGASPLPAGEAGRAPTPSFANAALRVGAILKLSALQREAALRRAMTAPLGKTAVDPSWLDRLLDAAFANIPEQLDDAQWDALVELVALVTDPSFGESLAAQSEPFWRRARRFDAARWERAWAAILRRGIALLEQSSRPGGERTLDPADPRVASLADAYVEMIAHATGRKADAATARWIVLRTADHDPRAERFWQLVSALHQRPPSPHAAIMRAILGALQLRQPARRRA